MLRTGFISYLALAIGIGPGLCCCILRAVPESVPTFRASTVSGCPHCAKKNQPTPPPSPKKCPCRESATCCGILPPATKPHGLTLTKLLSLLAASGDIPALASADLRVRIPMAAGVDSLNVAAAAAVACYAIAAGD